MSIAIRRLPDLLAGVRLAERLDASWFRTRARARMRDGDRELAKNLRTMRGLRLFMFWRRRS